jgi:hypothetical protein
MLSLIRYSLISAAFLFGLVGCGGENAVEVRQEVAESKPGINGGIAFPLPEKKGYAEVVIERGKPGQPVTLAVYLLDDSARAASTSNITASSAKLMIPGEESAKSVTLAARDSASKKAVGKRFASAPGAYDFDELKGEIIMSVDGKEVSVPFAFR